MITKVLAGEDLRAGDPVVLVGTGLDCDAIKAIGIVELGGIELHIPRIYTTPEATAQRADG